MDSLFTGAHTRRPTVNLGGARPAQQGDLIAQARNQRILREQTRRQDSAARTIQAFYRGRHSAHATRAVLRARFDALIAPSPSAPPPCPSPAVILAASRLLAVACIHGNPHDIKRLAAWARTVLRPHRRADKTPLVFALFRPENDPDKSWPTLVRILVTLLFVQATAAPALPQSPLFLELTKILCDPASYAKYNVPPSLASPDALVRFLVEQRGLYPRIAQLVQSAVQPTHPTLAPAIALSLLPFRTFPPSSPQRSFALSAIAHSLLSLPDLLTTRLAPPQAALLASPNSALPFWELLAQLASPSPSPSSSLSAVTTTDAVPPALLATLAELALRTPGRISADKGAVPGAKEVREWMAVVRRGLEGLPRGALAMVESDDKGKGVTRSATVKDDAAPSSSDDEDDEDDEAVERARAAVGAARAMSSEDARMGVATAPAAPEPLALSTRRSLSLLAAPTHLRTLLALSTRHAASTRPALASLLTTLLALLAPGTARDAALHTLLYTPAAAGLLRELYRAHLRAGPLARALAAARERTQGVLAALVDPAHAASGEWAVLVLVIEMYSRALVTLGDDEFYAAAAAPAGGATGASAGAARNPLSLDEVVGLSALARNVAFALYWSEDGNAAALPLAQRRVHGTGCSWQDIRGVMTRFLQQVHARDSRRQFTPEGHWLMTSSMDIKHFVETAVYEDERLEAEGAQDAPAPAQPQPQQRVAPQPASDDDDDEFAPEALQPRRYGPAGGRAVRRVRRTPQQLSKRQLALVSPRLGVLQNVPFVIPFETRVAIFRQFVASDFARLGLGDATSFAARSRHRAVVRRTHLAEDAFKQLNGLGAELKKRVEIAFIDEHGLEESGIDGGGLFKELLTSLSREVFDTDRGLWLATSQNELYPNPHAYAREPAQLAWFAFVGRILGKALYQGILVNVKFAGFFLSKWLGRQAYLDDLASLDPELYRGLVSLKNYPGNVEDLSLNFTITEEDFGVARSVDLIPRGSEIAVTNENRLQYIVLVSNYRLNVQIAPQCRAFFAGLSEMVNPRWLRLFSQSELAVLVGGTEEAIDIADLRAHTVYSGWAADENTPTIRAFWDVVATFGKDDRAKLVRFVTACERPPLLGFSQLNPLFAIRNAGSDEARLPTSATCVNLLKLPEYSDPENLREKLLYAINSGAGFDLS
ncbi:hypothetical protein JCM3770_001778 [Rhodotorula araucariae]